MKRAVLALAVVSMALVLGAGSPPRSSDYLDPELRVRVEQLKADVDTPTDSLEVLDRRLKTLWEWGNAYALSGGTLPLDFSAAVAWSNRTLANGIGEPGMTVGRVTGFITQMIREFQIKDEAPGAIGAVTLVDTGPFMAGDFVTIEEVYTVGEMPITPGGGVTVAQPTRWTQRPPVITELIKADLRDDLHLQADDPEADNHVTIRTSNPGARFKKVTPDATWKNFNTLPFVFFELEGVPLEPGDEIIVTFGDTSGGSRGMRVQHWTNDRVLLPIYPVFDAEDYPLTPKWPSYRVIGRAEVRRVEVVVRPSVVAPDEDFEVVLRSLDRFRQVSSGRTPEYELYRNGELVRRVAAASPAVTVLSGQTLSEPGVYRFAVRSSDGSLSDRSNPLWVRDQAGGRVFWGDTHGHSGFADGQGTPDNYYSFARDVARLDFVTLSEHGTWLDDAEWRTLQEMTRKYNDPGSFTAILGYEWTANRQFGGHHNVYFRDPDGRKRITNQVTTSLQELYDGLREAHRTDDVLIIPHAHQPGDWRKNDADMERLVEVNSGHGVFEWYGNRFLQQGFDVGFIGSSDDHTGHPGYLGMTHVQFAGIAGVIAPVNTGEALFDSMRARSAYATTGERIIIDAEFNGRGVGSKVPTGGGRSISCRVMGTEPIESIDLIKNGDVIYTRSYLTPGIAPRMLVQFSVESSSDVKGFTSPRRPRAWRGTLEVSGAELVGYRLPWFINPTRHLVRRDPANPNRLEFVANTRGRPKGMLLELDGASDSTEIRVALGTAATAEGLETRLGDLVEAPAVTVFGEGIESDSIRLAIVPDAAALDLDFEFKDLDSPEVGDYYYLRVRQVGGGMAFTSPWRVVEE
jgi:hypothetical protein